MIDWNKPIELSDGTPVVVEFRHSGMAYVRVPRGHAIAGRRNFLLDGSRAHGCRRADLYVRNRQEQPVTTLNLDKPLQTRSGLPAKFVANAADGRLIFEITSWGEGTLVYRYADGRVIRTPGAQDPGDIVEKVETKTAFYNLYDDGSTGKSVHHTLADARNRAKVGKVRIGIVEIVKTDGSVTSMTVHRCVPAVRTSGLSPAPWTPVA